MKPRAGPGKVAPMNDASPESHEAVKIEKNHAEVRQKRKFEARKYEVREQIPHIWLSSEIFLVLCQIMFGTRTYWSTRMTSK